MQRKLASLQVLRAVASIGVVVHHSYRSVTVFRPLPPGSLLIPPAAAIDAFAAGVDAFFLLSGFLMAYISAPYFRRERTVGQFIAQRVIRIWPPYLVAMATMLLLLVRYYFKTGVADYDLQPVRLAGFLFIPTANKEGLVQPIIGPGWTLSYEMMFYGLFAIVLWWGRRWAVAKLAGLLGAVYLIGLALGSTTAGKFLSSTITVEFLVGAAIGFAVTDWSFKPRRPLAWVTAGVLLVVLGTWQGLGVNQRVVAFGLPALLLFIGFLAAEDFRWPRWAVLLGDASYSIYLIHIMIITRVIDAVQHRLDTPALHRLLSSMSAVIAVLVAVAVGLVFHLLVEKPMLRLAQRFYNLISDRNAEAPMVAQP